MSSSSATNAPYPRPGEVLDGKYRVDVFLAEGGMGAVAKATHLLRRATVALKFMSPSARAHPGADQRFVNEAVAASRIDSEHVVKIFDVARLRDGSPYLVMEFLAGRDLGDLLEREGPRLPVPRAVHLALQMLRAVHTAHAAGVIHRDMKPSNCFIIDKDGEGDFVKVVDFGISKMWLAEHEASPAPRLTGTNTIFGTPHYMSPEQAKSSRDVDLRTDLYSVGAILYEMLSGRTPFAAQENIFYQLFMEEPDSLESHCPDLPAGLARAVHRALARDPAARFGSAVEMAEALAPFADGRSARVLGWLLGGRGRSLAPAGFGTVRPADPDACALPHEAAAPTHQGASGPPSRPSTDAPVLQEAMHPRHVPPEKRRGILWVAAGATALAIAGAGLMAARRCETKAPAVSAIAAASSLAPTTLPSAATPSSARVTAPPASSAVESPPSAVGVASRADELPPSAIDASARPQSPGFAASPPPETAHAPSASASAIPGRAPPPSASGSRVRQSGLEEEFHP